MERLNVLLAKTDHLASMFRAMIADYTKFFAKGQGAFRGEKNTYTANDGTMDQPNKRSYVAVQTTVEEKMEWWLTYASQYVDALFSVERTNATGITAELEVAGVSWGEFTSLELLRLKSLIEAGDFRSMLINVPVRSDGELWGKSADPDYKGRAVWQSPLSEGKSTTTTKEQYILKDPNIGNDRTGYVPQVSQKDTVVELGTWTRQKFSGEVGQRDRAMMLDRRDKLLLGVIEALKKCNEAESVASELNAKRVFGYIFNGIK